MFTTCARFRVDLHRDTPTIMQYELRGFDKRAMISFYTTCARFLFHMHANIRGKRWKNLRQKWLEKLQK